MPPRRRRRCLPPARQAWRCQLATICPTLALRLPLLALQEAYAEAAADLDAEARGGGKRRRRAGDAAAATAEGGGDDEDAFFASLSAQGRLPKFVELLKFKVGAVGQGVATLRAACIVACLLQQGAAAADADPPPPPPSSAQSLSKGCRLWGAVIEVGARELVVSLPHGLRGHVAYSEASDWLHDQAKAAERAAAADGEAGSDGGAAGGKKKRRAGAGAAELPPLASLFHIGQLVRCTVTGLRTGAPGEAAATGKQAGGKQQGGGGAKKRVDCSLRVSKMNAGLGEREQGSGLPLC